MIRLFLCFFSLSFSLIIADDRWDFEALHVKYEDTRLSLSENVCIEGALGRLTANQAFAWMEKGEIHEVSLQNYVVLETTNFGRLMCERLLLFPLEFQGKCVHVPNQRVSFHKDEWSIGADSALFSFQQGKGNRYLLDQLVAQGHVKMSLKEKGVLQSDSVYVTTLPFNKSGLYLFTFLPKKKNGKCRFSRENGDRFSANKIEVMQEARCLNLEHAEGKLCLGQKEKEQPLNFATETLFWNEGKNELTLEGAPRLFSENIHIVSKHRMIAQGIASHWTTWNHVLIQGPFTVKYKESFGNAHVLDGEGNALLSPQSNEIFVSSKETPLRYRHPQGLILSDTATLTYEVKEKNIEITHVRFQNNIQFIFRESENSPIQHYALADHMEIYPQEHHMKLWAKTGNKLTIYDYKRGIKMRAKQIKADTRKRDFSFKCAGKVDLVILQPEDYLRAESEMQL